MAEQIGKNRARFTLKEVAQAVSGRYIGFHENEIVGVATDSRCIEKNNLFIALHGENFDGHNYQQQALEKEVAAVLVDDWFLPQLQSVQVDNTLLALGDLARYHRKRFQIPVIAVTGSYGKTSTRALIHAALSQKHNTLTSQSNFNNEIGLPMTLFQLESEHEAAVVEMGMRGRGQIEYLAKIAEPTVGVITNIGPQHLELLGSLEEVAAAKAELIENLPENGLAVLPADSPFIAWLKNKATCRVVTFGASDQADYRISQIQTREDGNVSCHINGQAIELSLPGAHNAHNAAAAFAVARELGVAAGDIARGLASAEIPGARMRVLKLKNGVTLLDDCYNAGPDSTRAALQTLLDFPGSGRRVAVLGSMKELGAFSEVEHGKIGELAGQFCEVLIGVGGETRPLLNSAIASAREVENEIKTVYYNDASEVAACIAEWIQNGDVLLIKGSRSVGLEKVVEAAKEAHGLPGENVHI